MAEWQVVAQGTNIWDLASTIGELELRKGSELRVIMDLNLPLGWAFDLAGAELIFKPFTPEGMTLVDVYGEGNVGIVEMKADPAWLLAILAFIKAHWVAIIIAGFVLTVIIAFITVLVKIAVAPALPVAAIAIGGALAVIAILGLAAIAQEKRKGKGGDRLGDEGLTKR